MDAPPTGACRSFDLYRERFAKPGLPMYEAVTQPLGPVDLATQVDFTRYEILRHEGRRARHGASMMGPDDTHGHGTHEVARNVYSEYLPELRKLVHDGLASPDAAKVEAVKQLEAKLTEILESPNDLWYTGRMDPAEKERRQKAAEEFRKRYSK